MKRLNLIGIVVLAAAGLTACGSDDHHAPAPTPPPTPTPTPVPMVDAFFSAVSALLASSPDDSEPKMIEAIVATSPEDTEPVPLG